MKNIRVLASLLLLLFISGQTVRLADGSAAGETRYTVLMMGNKAGYESSIANPAGGSRLYYEFNDRGRGPKITEDIVVDKDGIPSTTHNAGIDYYKAPVEEYFSLSSGNASWKNRAEAGQQQTSAQDASTNEKAKTYVIKRGDTLWAIAKHYLGSGFLYSSIFQDNREVIKNPDLILPKQEVKMPKP